MVKALRIDGVVMAAGMNPSNGENELLSVTTFDPPALRIDGIYMLAGIAPDGSNVLVTLNSDGTLGSSGGGGAPSGAAGGDLGGTYPSPTVLSLANVTNGPAAAITSGVLATARLGSGSPSTANVLRGDGAWSNTIVGPVVIGTNGVTLETLAIDSLQLGEAPSATPTGQILTIGEASRPGTDSNTAGASGTVRSGLGTGTGTVSTLIFQTPTVAGAGSGVQAYATRLTLSSAAATFVPQVLVTGGTSSNPSIGLAAQANIGINFSLTSTTIFQAGSERLYIDATNMLIGGGGSAEIRYLNGTYFGFAAGTGAIDVSVRRLAAASLRIGAANSATPIANLLTIGETSRAGTDNNVGGAAGTVQAGLGTGIGTLAPLNLRSPIAVASGTGAQTYATGLQILGGTAKLTSYTVATLPPTASVGAGATAFVTDASTTIILGLGQTVVGGGANQVPVYNDGTNWIIG